MDRSALPLDAPVARRSAVLLSEDASEARALVRQVRNPVQWLRTMSALVEAFGPGAMAERWDALAEALAERCKEWVEWTGEPVDGAALEAALWELERRLLPRAQLTPDALTRLVGVAGRVAPAETVRWLAALPDALVDRIDVGALVPPRRGRAAAFAGPDPALPVARAVTRRQSGAERGSGPAVLAAQRVAQLVDRALVADERTLGRLPAAALDAWLTVHGVRALRPYLASPDAAVRQRALRLVGRRSEGRRPAGAIGARIPPGGRPPVR